MRPQPAPDGRTALPRTNTGKLQRFRLLPPGYSDTASIARVRELFADILDGHEVHATNSRWISFATVRNSSWRHGNVVLLGDAAHTAHFSIGSGTKLAMEDALALAACLHEHPTVEAALTACEAERKPVVLSTQRAAQASLERRRVRGGRRGRDRRVDRAGHATGEAGVRPLVPDAVR
ncbi:FAD-dependent monooxygenase [Planosporangium mesophilum]|uniref:FAD-binding domain-containing protein n=1 Tax=Planosporangium mesophilum TaxID=689768 RepID=A0A8J3X2Z0_9ACTN|nr:FAD-dependent monooxygenase [Planosporangium mesophilum]GII25955.1 hypothetical protein Pme01_55520 [Planosporangium mesophilum]